MADCHNMILPRNNVLIITLSQKQAYRFVPTFKDKILLTPTKKRATAFSNFLKTSGFWVQFALRLLFL